MVCGSSRSYFIVLYTSSHIYLLSQYQPTHSPLYHQEKMSTNNNRLGKEVQPDWKDEDSKTCQMKKFSADKLQRLTAGGSVDKITALSLSSRGVCSIESTTGLSALRRLDLSKNKLKRLTHMANLSSLGMLNISGNEFAGPEALEELRYLPELRTLNIGENPSLGRVKKQTLQSLPHLHALIAHECGIASTEFLCKADTLSTIILSKNSLDSFPKLPETSFHNLVKLNIGYNKFTTFPDLSFCHNMEELKINNNMLGSIPSSILQNKKLKTLSVASNQISSWASMELLTGLPNLTNLSAKGNPLPVPPAETNDFVLREDLSAEKIKFSDSELAYRRHLLGLFQIHVGLEQKLKVRLIVLDMHRVKAKWSHQMLPTAELGAVALKHKPAKAPTKTEYKKEEAIRAKDEVPKDKEEKKRKKRPREEESMQRRSDARSEDVVEEQTRNIVPDGEVLGSKRKVDTATKDKSGFSSIEVAQPSEQTAGVPRDRGAETGVLAVSMHAKKKKRQEERNEASTKVKRKGDSKANSSAGSTRTIEEVLFGAGAQPGLVATPEPSGWD